MPLNTIMRTLMQKNQLTASGLAHLADIPFPTISRILAGEVIDPTLSVMKKISQALGVTLSQLVGEDALSEYEQ